MPMPYSVCPLNRLAGMDYKYLGKMGRVLAAPLSGVGSFLDPSVAQPPLPLHEFLPLQPLSLDLQPPLPLQEFWPLQACFSVGCLSAFLSWDWSCAANEDLDPGSRLDAWIVAPLPASNPASAAPAIKAFFDL